MEMRIYLKEYAEKEEALSDYQHKADMYALKFFLEMRGYTVEKK